MNTQTPEPPAEIREAASMAEVEAAAAVLDAVHQGQRGWQSNRVQLLEIYRATPGLLSIAIDNGRIVGCVGCDGVGVVQIVAVLKDWRGRGLGRRLLERAEGILRARGATTAGLGSLDAAVEFYLACGYRPQLLVQFAPDVDDPESLVKELCAGPLAGREVVHRVWQGHVQLWLQHRSLDWALKRRVENVAEGVVAQYVMIKQLTAPPVP